MGGSRPHSAGACCTIAGRGVSLLSVHGQPPCHRHPTGTTAPTGALRAIVNLMMGVIVNTVLATDMAPPLGDSDGATETVWPV